MSEVWWWITLMVIGLGTDRIRRIWSVASRPHGSNKGSNINVAVRIRIKQIFNPRTSADHPVGLKGRKIFFGKCPFTSVTVTILEGKMRDYRLCQKANLLREREPPCTPNFFPYLPHISQITPHIYYSCVSADICGLSNILIRNVTFSADIALIE